MEWQKIALTSRDEHEKLKSNKVLHLKWHERKYQDTQKNITNEFSIKNGKIVAFKMKPAHFNRFQQVPTQTLTISNCLIAEILTASLE